MSMWRRASRPSGSSRLGPVGLHGWKLHDAKRALHLLGMDSQGTQGGYSWEWSSGNTSASKFCREMSDLVRAIKSAFQLATCCSEIPSHSAVRLLGSPATKRSSRHIIFCHSPFSLHLATCSLRASVTAFSSSFRRSLLRAIELAP